MKKEDSIQANDESFRVYKDEINEKNFKMMKYLSVIASIISACILIVTLPMRYFDFYTEIIYIIWIVVSCLVMAVAVLMKQRIAKHSTLLLYLYLTVLFVSCIVSGTVLLKNQASAAVIGAIVAIPFILFDKYWRFCLYEVCGCILFCVLSFVEKSPSLALLDCLNAVGFTAFACVMGIKTIQLKLSDIRTKAAITAQRDTDQMTGLTARTAAERIIESYCMRGEASGALFMMDIDNFKNINDTYGHAKGDEALKQIAGTVRACFRSGDLAARFGGDEIVVFAPGIESEEWAKERAESLKRAVEDAPAAKSLGLSLSVGVSFFYGSKTFEQLYAEADAMLYQAKAAGKNCYMINCPEFSSDQNPAGDNCG